MSKGRKVGSGKVVVNGKVMTTQSYVNCVEQALINNGNNWMTTDQIISWGYANGLCERKNAPRRAVAHPMYKIMSMIIDNTTDISIQRRLNNKGILEYQLKDPKHIMINGELYDVTH